MSHKKQEEEEEGKKPKKLVSRFKTINQTRLRYDPVIKITR